MAEKTTEESNLFQEQNIDTYLVTECSVNGEKELTDQTSEDKPFRELSGEEQQTSNTDENLSSPTIENSGQDSHPLTELPTQAMTSESSTTIAHSVRTQGWTTVSLEPTLTLTNLDKLHTQLKNCQQGRVQLYGARVERIDTATLQLLLAFMNSPEVTVGWTEPSLELRHAAHLLGLTAQLSLPAAEERQP